MDPALEPPSARSALPDAQDGELPGRMDINRGPRRARHVAASLRATNERRTDNGDGNGNEAPPPPRGQRQQRLTPTNTAASHRTPEQDLSDAAPSNAGGRMPPVNPFRLHRGGCWCFLIFVLHMEVPSLMILAVHKHAPRLLQGELQPPALRGRSLRHWRTRAV
jgi:hypothetical protein